MWRLRFLRRRDVAAFVLGAVVIGALALLSVNGWMRSRWNYGFGPEWRCTYVGKGEPVCIKDPPKPQ
jgi:hypothetical protein